MEEIKWIKITTDMFDNKKIKYLRRLPDGNNIVLIWVMLLTMAGRCNANGMIFLTENIPYTTKMLADELGFEENTVRLALEALEQLDMVVTKEGRFAIAGWSEHQNTAGLEKIREQNRLRKRKQREDEKLLACDMSRDSHVTVTQCHAIDKEIEIEREKEGEKEKVKKKKTGSAENTLTLFDRIRGDYEIHETLEAKLREWLTYKDERKEGYKELGLRALLRRIETSCSQYGKEAIIDLIDESMVNGWKGIIFDRLNQAQRSPGYNDNIRNRVSQVDDW